MARGHPGATGVAANGQSRQSGRRAVVAWRCRLRAQRDAPARTCRVIAIRGSSAAPRDGWQVVLPGLGRPWARWKWSAPTQRDTYVGAVGLSAVALFVFAALHPTDEPWNLLA